MVDPHPAPFGEPESQLLSRLMDALIEAESSSIHDRHLVMYQPDGCRASFTGPFRDGVSAMAAVEALAERYDEPTSAFTVAVLTDPLEELGSTAV